MIIESKKVKYSVKTNEIATFILNELENINEGFYVTEIKITRTDLGYPLMEVTSVKNTK